MFRRPLLEQIEIALRKAGQKALLVPASQDDAVEGVVVELGPDRKGRTLFLKLALASTARAVMKAAGHPAVRSGEGGEGEFDYLQYYSGLPFRVAANRMDQAGQLILRLNGTLPLVGFGLNVFEKLVYFRHLVVVENQTVNGRLVARTAELISFLLREFGPTIEDVATGEKTLAEVHL